MVSNKMLTLTIFGNKHLTRISCKDSRKGSSEKNIRSNFIVLSSLKCKIEHFKPYFMNLVPGVFEIRYTLFM